MAMDWRWVLSNKYVHLRALYGPSAGSDVVPDSLRVRLTKRLDRAVQLAKWRGVLFVLLYAGAIGTVVTAMLGALAEATELAALADLGRLAEIAIVLAPLVVLLAGIGVALVTRLLGLLEADILALGAEAVARNLAAKEGRVLPSEQRIRNS